MAQEIDNNLMTMWLNADRLPVTVIRALIEELNERRHRRVADPYSRNTVTFFRQTKESNALDYPLLEIARNGRVL